MKPTLRCSSLDRLIACPGSRTLEALVNPRQSEEGNEGTYIHSEIQLCLIRDLGAINGGPIFFYDGPLFPNSQWIVGYCVRECAEKLPSDWSLEVETGLSYEFDKFILSGHIDALALSPDATEAIGFDWKSVYNAVDIAEQNEQVLGYVILLARAYPSLRKVTFYIVQPRVDEEMGFQRVSSVTIEITPGFIANFERRIERTLAYNMSLSSGPKQCRFCPAFLQCPALIEEREEMKITVNSEMLALIQKEPDDKLIASWVVSAKTLDAPIEQAREIAKARILEKGYITDKDGLNISIKKTAGAYEVTDPDQFQKSLLTLIPVERLAHVTKPSVTKIKDEIAKVLDIPKTGKAAITAESLFDAKLRPFVSQGEKLQLIFS